MKRAARLQSAASWLKKYSGENILRGYCKQYAVDWRCAAIELRQLGVELEPDYLRQREVTEQQVAAARKQRREAQAVAGHPDSWHEYGSPLEAYLAEDYAALHAMECERDGSFRQSIGPVAAKSRSGQTVALARKEKPRDEGSRDRR